jgi:membrane fusion protein, adhesin transport system
MLNISNNSIKDKFKKEEIEILNTLSTPRTGIIFSRWLVVIFLILLFILFLPWQQNIDAKGNVIAFSPANRQQNIQNIIGGRIEKWNLVEGNLFKKGDTLVIISESKDDYLDPNLSTRINEQISAKNNAINAYKTKIDALKSQIVAIKQAQVFSIAKTKNKLIQAKQKFSIDSTNYIAQKKNYEIALDRLNRFEKGQNDGLFSKTDLETRKLKVQDDLAKLQEINTKLDISKNEILNAKIEINAVNADYQKDIAKANSDLSSSLVALADGESELSKIMNKSSSINQRQGNYVIKAPQDGYLLKTIKAGIGEYLKEGETICYFQPADPDISIEMYVKAIDMPLIEIGREVRVQFEGWPVLIFSGWKNTSVGTFGGTVEVIDKAESSNNMFRILVKPKKDEPNWPKQLGIGSGAIGWVMLDNVPIWYEIWRQLNSFPPNEVKEKSTKKAEK